MKIPIKNLKFKDYYSLQTKDLYNFALRNANIEPEDYFQLGDVKNYSFGFVRDMQIYCQKKSVHFYLSVIARIMQLVANEKNLQVQKLYNLSFVETWQSYLYLLNEVQFINEMERNNLVTEPDAKEERAGVEVFAKFGVFAQIDKLANGNILAYDSIIKQPYMTCFNKLLYEKEKNLFAKRLSKQYEK